MNRLGISKRDMNIIFLVIGTVIFLLSQFYIAGKFRETTKTVTNDTLNYQPHLQELMMREMQLPLYEAEIENAKIALSAIRETYPEVVLAEDFIVFAAELEEKIGMDITALTFEEPTLLGDFVAPDANENPVFYSMYTVPMSFIADLSYEEMKEAIKLVYAESGKTAVQKFSVVYNSETGILSGEVQVSKEYINDGLYRYVPPKVPAGSIGTPNPFQTVGTMAE